MLFSTIETFIAKHHLIPKGSKIILGLSGGPDSVFLLFFLKKLRDEGIISDLVAAYLDHQWRADSQNDVKFCQELTNKLSVPLVVGKMSDFESEVKFDGSREAQGRHARRKFLEHVRKEKNANLIALAHHLQDQEETFFIRLIRGTSLAGLTCMRPKSGNFIRPLLEINKADIITYLDEHNISYLTDPSNESPEFLRNRIRSTVLPALHACDKRFDHNFLMTLNRLQATDNFLHEITKKFFDELSTKKDDTLLLNVQKLLKTDSALLNRLLIYWLVQEQVPFIPTESFLEEILRFLRQPPGGKHQIHTDWRIVKQQGKVFIEKTN